jgi:hypothetical protein
MNFPLDLTDISLFLAVLSVILLPTSILIPQYYKTATTLIRKLKKAALAVSFLFLLTVAFRVVTSFLF